MARVLVVDDSPQVRRLLRVMLESQGHLVIEAEDGRAGWRLMLNERPDLVIMDVMMPGPSGFEVCRAMREDSRLAVVPIIILTADGLAESEHRAMADGASGFMLKPFSPLALTTMIDALLRPS